MAKFNVNGLKCMHCDGTGILNRDKTVCKSNDVQKLLKIMHDHNLTHLDIARIIGITKQSAYRMFFDGSNKTGRVKKMYFDILRLNGYE